MASHQGAGMLRRTTHRMLALAIVGGAASTATAQVELTGGLDSRFTDNARKSSSNETSDLESRAYLKADYASDPGRCNSNFSGTIGYARSEERRVGKECRCRGAQYALEQQL